MSEDLNLNFSTVSHILIFGFCSHCSDSNSAFFLMNLISTRMRITVSQFISSSSSSPSIIISKSQRFERWVDLNLNFSTVSHIWILLSVCSDSNSALLISLTPLFFFFFFISFQKVKDSREMSRWYRFKFEFFLWFWVLEQLLILHWSASSLLFFFIIFPVLFDSTGFLQSLFSTILSREKVFHIYII